MSITAPEIFDAPKGNENSLDSAAQTLRSKAGTVGTTLSTYTNRTASAMDAMSSVRAQQLFYYVGKATSMLKNAESTASGAADAISEFSGELSDVKEVLETERNKWVDLAYDERALREAYESWQESLTLYTDPLPPQPPLLTPSPAPPASPPVLTPPSTYNPYVQVPTVDLTPTGVRLMISNDARHYPDTSQVITGAQGELEDKAADQQLRMTVAASTAAETLTGLYLELDPVDVMAEAKAYELELFETRTGMTLADLGYDTPEEQLAWLTGEGQQMRDHELRYSEYAQRGFGQRTEQDLVDAGELPPEALDDGLYTPGTVPGVSPREDWEHLLEDGTLDGVVGDLRRQFPSVLDRGGSPLTEPWSAMPQGPSYFDPPVPADGTGTPDEAAAVDSSQGFDVRSAVSLAGTGRHVWRYYIPFSNSDPRIVRLGRLGVDLYGSGRERFDDWWNGRAHNPNFANIADRMSLSGSPHTQFYNPLRGESAFRNPYEAFITGDRDPGAARVMQPDGSYRAGHIARIQQGAGQTSAFTPNWLTGKFPDMNPKLANGISAFDLGVSRSMGVAGVVSDVGQLISGDSKYGMDTTRGRVDYAMAGVGAASGIAGLASTAGLVTLGTVAAPVTMAAGAVAGAWAVGNLVYDNAEKIDETLDDAGAAANQWLSEHGGVVGDVVGDGVAATLDGVGNLATGFKSGVDATVDLAKDVGDALTFWD